VCLSKGKGKKGKDIGVYLEQPQATWILRASWGFPNSWTAWQKQQTPLKNPAKDQMFQRPVVTGAMVLAM
jgi:hypothetical protein